MTFVDEGLARLYTQAEIEVSHLLLVVSNFMRNSGNYMADNLYLLLGRVNHSV